MRNGWRWIACVLLTLSPFFGMGAPALAAARAAAQSTPPATQDAVIPWQQAGEHIGQTVTVTGTLARVHDTGRVTYLNFDEDWRGKFAIVVFPDMACALGHELEERLLGKAIAVTGSIKEYKGAPEILLENPSQLCWADGSPVAPPQRPSAHMPAAPQALGLRLVSWNVENLFDELDDPHRNDQGTPSTTPRRLKQVADVIRAMNPDVLALQEIENRALLEEFNREHLPDLGYEAVLFEGNDARGIDVALLTRLPVESVTSYRHLRFADGLDGTMGFRRDLLRVKLGGAFDADVYIVHLKSQHGGDEADVKRLAEAQEIARILGAELAADPDYRAVICGDFNDVPDSPTLQTLLELPLLDSCAGTEQYSYNKEPYLTRIDFALFTPALARELHAAAILPELEGLHLRCTSDHFPLRADLTTGLTRDFQIGPGVATLTLHPDGSYEAFVFNGMVDGCATVEGAGSSTGMWALCDSILSFHPSAETDGIVRSFRGATLRHDFRTLVCQMGEDRFRVE